ncbi:unnamed protein product [Arctia plantaginis]|uniref:Uncharacterized protein n=1 Tax=Arctia plantaginis TaxID=874455 RepID=A0A8S0ZDY9_ARCPL|nr:unnamed protein product [Arctia plantaginis]CAB3234972.1 unnamed protein product [Arctia plantaginis]
MFVKVLALCLVLGICLAHPIEDVKLPVPIDVPPPNAQGVPVKPLNADSSDLKTDPSTWWHSSWYHTSPVYYYYHAPRPAYTYWHHYY